MEPWDFEGNPRNARTDRAPQPLSPIPMILHCPNCGLQHIDAPERQDPNERDFGMTTKESQPWTNPPHRSHLCAGCGHIWRPADVPTTGVKEIKTKGRNDSPLPPARTRRGTDSPIVGEAMDILDGGLPVLNCPACGGVYMHDFNGCPIADKEIDPDDRNTA